MKDGTTPMVKALFQRKFGIDATKVMGLGGEEPDEENRYLYNQIMNQFEGFVKTSDGDTYLFFITKPDSDWVIETSKIG